jgi:hypothetical protein
MIVAGIIRDKSLFTDFYTYLIGKIKSRRWLLILVSALCGILPVPGRVTVSAGILDTMSSPNKKSRENFGLIDYLSTHHYYLWSPLEKTVIIPMAALGLSYTQFIGHTWPLLLITIVYTAWYIFTKIKEDDIDIRVATGDEKFKSSFIVNITPLLLAIVLMIAGVEPYYVFPALLFYYVTITSMWVEWKNWIKHINFKLVLFLAIIIIMSNIAVHYEENFRTYLDKNRPDITQPVGMALVSLIALGSSFLLGSSSRFAGIVVLLTGIYGIEYFTLFFTLEFAGYLVSPFHKCLSIGKFYFKTPVRHYMGMISLWCFFMIGYAYFAH